ncbi:MAG TPA: hypothetical protein VFB26_07035 [Gaiellaceae bacterium]|nr:hypothetical protein [Gaiellaceae bacterium]
MLSALLVLAASSLTVGSASSAVAATACEEALAQPFQPWLDPAWYALAPDGGLERGGAGWQLGGGAAVSSGNEPWAVSGPGSHVLALPSGAVAATPPVCVGLLHPSARLFVRNAAPLGLGLLKVDAEVTAAGVQATVPVAVVTAGARFQPTLPLALLANLATPLEGGTGSVRLRFTALGGAWELDDVYVDPFKTT